jgi:hypothetical protein
MSKPLSSIMRLEDLYYSLIERSIAKSSMANYMAENLEATDASKRSAASTEFK